MVKILDISLVAVTFVAALVAALLLSAVPAKAGKVEVGPQIERLESLRYYDAWMYKLTASCDRSKPTCNFYVATNGDGFVLMLLPIEGGWHLAQIADANNSGLNEPFSSNPSQVIFVPDTDRIFDEFMKEFVPKS